MPLTENDVFVEDLGLIGDAAQGQSEQAQGPGLWPEPHRPPQRDEGLSSQVNFLWSLESCNLYIC